MRKNMCAYLARGNRVNSMSVSQVIIMVIGYSHTELVHDKSRTEELGSRWPDRGRSWKRRAASWTGGRALS